MPRWPAAIDEFLHVRVSGLLRSLQVGFADCLLFATEQTKRGAAFVRRWCRRRRKTTRGGVERSCKGSLTLNPSHVRQAACSSRCSRSDENRRRLYTGSTEPAPVIAEPEDGDGPTAAAHRRQCLRIPTVAELLDVSPSTVRRLIRDGRLEAISIGSSVRVIETSVERLINAGRRRYRRLVKK